MQMTAFSWGQAKRCTWRRRIRTTVASGLVAGPRQSDQAVRSSEALHYHRRKEFSDNLSYIYYLNPTHYTMFLWEQGEPVAHFGFLPFLSTSR